MWASPARRSPRSAPTWTTRSRSSTPGAITSFPACSTCTCTSSCPSAAPPRPTTTAPARESARVLDELIARHHTPAMMNKYGARLHAMTRPNFVEAEAIQRAVMWSEATGGQLYIVHMSTGEGADIIRAAQARGVPVIAETCVQYLVLDDSVFEREDGHLYACCPQLKKPKDVERLWKGLKSGEVSVVSTDTS